MPALLDNEFADLLLSKLKVAKINLLDFSYYSPENSARVVAITEEINALMREVKLERN